MEYYGQKTLQQISCDQVFYLLDDRRPLVRLSNRFDVYGNQGIFAVYLNEPGSIPELYATTTKVVAASNKYQAALKEGHSATALAELEEGQFFFILGDPLRLYKKHKGETSNAVWFTRSLDGYDENPIRIHEGMMCHPCEVVTYSQLHDVKKGDFFSLADCLRLTYAVHTSDGACIDGVNYGGKCLLAKDIFTNKSVIFHNYQRVNHERGCTTQ